MIPGSTGGKPERSRPRGLDVFFRPRGVAVVGASRDPQKVGHAVLRNLLFGGPGAEGRERGFQGAIVPVHREAKQVLGLPAQELGDLSGPIDLAVVAIPAPGVPDSLDALARRGVRGAIVLAAGFFEMGEEGRRLGQRVRSVAQNAGIRLIGPNCTGIFAAGSSLSASFFSVAPRVGPVSLISQSGSLAQALVRQSIREQVGYRNVVSLGDRADVSFPELIRYFGRDEATRVITVYLESLHDAREFYEAARLTAPEKPLVVLRGGSTGAGHRAAKLHEGQEALRDTVLDSALAHPGIYQAPSLPAFLSAQRVLSLQPPAQGRGLAIVTNAGGPGVLAADAAARAGLEVVKLRHDTQEKLRAMTSNPRAWSNPVDLLGDAKPKAFRRAIEIVAAAPEVDAVLVVLTDQALIDPVEVIRSLVELVEDKELAKPLVLSSVGRESPEVRRPLEKQGVPTFVYPEHAVAGLAAAVFRGTYLRRQALRAPRRPAPSLAHSRSQALLKSGARSWWKSLPRAPSDVGALPDAGDASGGPAEPGGEASSPGPSSP